MNLIQNTIADAIINHTPIGTGSPIAHLLRFLPPETTKEEFMEVTKILKKHNLVSIETSVLKNQPVIKLRPKGQQLQATGENAHHFMIRTQAQAQSFLNGLGLGVGILAAILLVLYFLSHGK